MLPTIAFVFFSIVFVFFVFLFGNSCGRSILFIIDSFIFGDSIANNLFLSSAFALRNVSVFLLNYFVAIAFV